MRYKDFYVRITPTNISPELTKKVIKFSVRAF